VGIVGSWWVLVPVMLADFATTFGVVAYIARCSPTTANRLMP
jgi:hypothetical protein